MASYLGFIRTLQLAPDRRIASEAVEASPECLLSVHQLGVNDAAFFRPSRASIRDPMRRDAFARRVRTGPICHATANALLASSHTCQSCRFVMSQIQVASFGLKSARPKASGWKNNRQLINTRSADFGPELMHHDIIRVHAQQHVWEKSNSRRLDDDLRLMSPTGNAQALPLIVKTLPLVIGIKLRETVLRRDRSPRNRRGVSFERAGCTSGQ